MKYAAIALALAMWGCAAPGPKLEAYHPEHNDQARYTRDLNECDYESRKATGSYTPDTRGMRTEIGRAYSAHVDMNSRLIDIGMSCMRARGYLFRPVGEAAASSPPPPAPYVATPAPFHGQHAGHAINMARTLGCSRDPHLNMTEKVADVETYWGTCTDGRPLQIRCEAGYCKPLNR